jgi:hypothetical protein
VRPLDYPPSCLYKDSKHNLDNRAGQCTLCTIVHVLDIDVLLLLLIIIAGRVIEPIVLGNIRIIFCAQGHHSHIAVASLHVISIIVVHCGLSSETERVDLLTVTVSHSVMG